MLRPPIVETLKKAKCGVGVSRRLAKYGGKEYSALVLGKVNRW